MKLNRERIIGMKKKVAVLGASGYTGSDAIRLLARHPYVVLSALTANSHAGKTMSEVFPHFFAIDLPVLTEWEAVDWTKQDAVVCGLPHGTTQDIIAAVLTANPAIKVLDMSADFRLRDKAAYAHWYGREHRALHLQDEAVYGLTEFYREKIAAARLVACPGCYPTAALLALVPLAKAGLVDAHDLVIDAKSGVTGSGRGLKQASLFAEAGEGLSPYSIGTHRHSSEIEQEISVVTGAAVTVNFTPHLIPMARGELCTCYVRLNGATVDDLRAALEQAYRGEPFVHVTQNGVIPRTQNVRGSNHVQIGVFSDRIKGRAIVIATLDNLVKGSAGQAIQNMNLMFGWPEATGLEQIALFP